MSKPDRLPGTLPAAFSKTGQDVPPSPEVLMQGLAEMITVTSARTVVEVLEPVLAALRPARRAMCIVCAASAKEAEQEWEVKAKNALAAAEPEPAKPDVKLTESFTEGARGPVCWACYSPPVDGPYDMAGILPPPVD